MTAPRTARVTIVLPPSIKERWAEEAEKRHWTLTTLIEVAVDELLARDKRKKALSE